MIVMGDYEVKINDDNWTVNTVDGSIAVHFEHTIVVRKNNAEILSHL